MLVFGITFICQTGFTEWEWMKNWVDFEECFLPKPLGAAWTLPWSPRLAAWRAQLWAIQEHLLLALLLWAIAAEQAVCVCGGENMTEREMRQTGMVKLELINNLTWRKGLGLFWEEKQVIPQTAPFNEAVALGLPTCNWGLETSQYFSWFPGHREQLSWRKWLLWRAWQPAKIYPIPNSTLHRFPPPQFWVFPNLGLTILQNSRFLYGNWSP